jgi:hypothetical protein
MTIRRDDGFEIVKSSKPKLPVRKTPTPMRTPLDSDYLDQDPTPKSKNHSSQNSNGSSKDKSYDKNLKLSIKLKK